jgi:FSR family fosmidomycin resistance protein-like MFS transporter
LTHSSAGSSRSDRTDPGAFQTSRVISITGAHAVHDTYTAFLPPLLPAFMAKLALSTTEAGALTVYMQAPSVLLPYIGYLADRVRLRYLVILTPGVTAVTMSLLGIAPRYAVLALLLTVVGFSSAAFHSVGPVMAGRLSGPKLGRGMGLWMVGGELGRTLGPLVIVTTVSLLTLEGTTWLVFGGILASMLLYVLLKDIPDREPHTTQPISFRQGLRLFKPLLAPLVGIVTGRVFMLAALTTYLPVFLMEEGSAFWLAGVSLTVLEAAGVAGALAGGSLSDRVGRRLVLFATMLCAPLLMLIFLITRDWPRFALLLPIGFTALAVEPVMMALVQESFPENRALANGVYLALTFVIRSAAVLALGAAADLFGLRIAFAISAIVPLLGLPFLLLLPGGSA